MSEDKFNYGETICEAIDTIISKRLEGLSYDITKTCIIIDDTYKRQGKYTVKDGALKFEAYSTITTLNINDNVLVSIPSGDYRLQKTILNKVMFDETSTTLNYISPLDNMLKFTDNIIDSFTPITPMQNGAFGLLANDVGNKNIAKIIYSIPWENFSGFDRLGVSANFQTRLNQYNIISGNYGIQFLFYSDGKKNDVITFNFDTSDMNGNPYHFDGFFNQSKLFDISKLENIKRLDIVFYQESNFIDENNELIPYQTEADLIANIPSEKMNNNIFMKDLKIYLGYSLSEFNGDSVKISTPNYTSYNKLDTQTEVAGGKRFLNLRWIHQIGENEYVSFTNDDVAKNNIKIYWLRYALNQNRSELTEIAGGTNWTMDNIAQSRNRDVFQSEFQPDYNKAQERIRAVCAIQNDLGVYEYYRSDILTFDNENSTVDTTTYDATTWLTIECLDGSEGNYFIYNPSGKIINEGHGQGYERKFEAKFKGLPLTSAENGLQEISEITWTIPVDGTTKQTMLTYKDSYWNEDEVQNDELGNFKYITRKIGDQPLITTQSYSIKNNWHSSNSSNLIRCEIVADGAVFQASLDLQFGKAGTSGTNITLVLEFNNNENAIIYIPGKESKCIVNASMYDMAGSKITTPEGTWEWKWLYENSIIQLSSGDSSSIELTLPDNFDTINLNSNYHILSATFIPTTGTKITTYLPIPIKLSGYDYIEGAREVIYSSQGVPDYYTDAYVLFGNSGSSTQIEIDNVTWTLNNSNAASTSFSLKELNKNGKKYYGLLANPFYIKENTDKICVCASVGGTVVWSQPILIMQSQYDYATLNNWSGSVEVGDRTIMSAMLGAGKKNNQNQFSGIIIGDLAAAAGMDDESIPETTGIGLYGLSNGIVSFSLTETGVATFGSIESDTNQGKVILGGDSNIITDANGHYLINIDTGVNSIIHGNSQEVLTIGDSAYSSYLSLLNKNGSKILNFSKDTYYLQSANYGTNGLQLNLSSGQFAVDHMLNSTKKSLIIDSSSESALKLDKLSIDWTGKITCNDLSVTNLIATNGSISINTTSNTDVISIGDNIRITKDGTIYYKGTELTEYIEKLIADSE